MAVEKPYLSDAEVILSHRYDNGGDLWATADKRLLMPLWDRHTVYAGRISFPQL